MELQRIVPDVIDKVPPTLSVKFADEIVNLGNILTPTKVKNIPTISWNSKPDKFYTICLTDPDAPNRANPIFKEFQHWLVVNIPGHEINGGETLAEYISSAPGKDTGLHRYTFVLYQQKAQLTCDEPKLDLTGPERRRQFSIRNFALKYGLGEPIAANFYQAEWDEYVPVVRKLLGFDK